MLEIIYFQDAIDKFQYAIFYIHFTFITLEMVFTFVSDFPKYYSPNNYRQLTEETKSLLHTNGYAKKEPKSDQDHTNKKASLTISYTLLELPKILIHKFSQQTKFRIVMSDTKNIFPN